MQLKWFGQSCFLLTSPAGTRVLMDPCARWFGYRMPQVQAEAVTSSHSHSDHNYLQMAEGNFIPINQAGTWQVKDISIHGTVAWHDDSQGAKRGRNMIYSFGVEGLKVCHLGDLGHLLSPDQIADIGKVDVLLLPVGGAFAISVAGALEVRKQLQPSITVPMHYRTPALGLMGWVFAPVGKFLALAGQAARELPELSVDPVSLADAAGIVVLEY